MRPLLRMGEGWGEGEPICWSLATQGYSNKTKFFQGLFLHSLTAKLTCCKVQQGVSNDRL